MIEELEKLKQKAEAFDALGNVELLKLKAETYDAMLQLQISQLIIKQNAPRIEQMEKEMRENSISPPAQVTQPETSLPPA